MQVHYPKRALGFYWVKWQGDWAVAEWVRDGFMITGIHIDNTNQDDITEVNETKLVTPIN